MRRAFLLAFALSLGFVPARGAGLIYSGQNQTMIAGSDTPSNLAATLTMPAGASSWVQGYNNPSLPGDPDAEVRVTLGVQGFTATAGVTNRGTASIITNVGFGFAPDVAANLHFVATDTGAAETFEILDFALNTNPPFTTPFVYIRSGAGMADISLAAGHSYTLQAFPTGTGDYSSTITGTLTTLPEPATYSLLLIGAALLTCAAIRR